MKLAIMTIFFAIMAGHQDIPIMQKPLILKHFLSGTPFAFLTIDTMKKPNLL